MQPTKQELEEHFLRKYGNPRDTGWSPRYRYRFGYWTPDDYYEALVARRVTGATEWVDIGCGGDIFPSNRATAKILAGRCRRLVGIDPSPNIEQNPFVHEKHQCLLEDYQGRGEFTLATMRMVAEHIEDPRAAVQQLARLLLPGGLAVIFTVNLISVVTLVSMLTPLWFHHAVKSALWHTEEKDTFPVHYRMNRRSVLNRLFREGGFEEAFFMTIDDCRALTECKMSTVLSLASWRVFDALGLRYPDSCLLGVYQRLP